MIKDLTASDLHRRNILNNQFAIREIEQEVAFLGVAFEGSVRYTKRQLAQFFDIDERTVNRYLEQHEGEVTDSGYEVITGIRLRNFKEAYEQFIEKTEDVEDIDVLNIEEDVGDIDVVNIAKAPKLGVFTFRAFLNIGMLLTESERAKQLRAFILDIVLDTLNKKLGGSTKYINQREEEFLPTAIREYSYRQEFTNAIDECVEGSKLKYGLLTDAVYKCIFHENAKEYKQILNLKAKEPARATMYTEVLDLVAAYENGFAEYLRQGYEKKSSRLTLKEALSLFKRYQTSNQAFTRPLLDKARTLMASRDMAFRDALHEKLKNYVVHLSNEEFDRFLGERSMALEERLKENIDVFKRLKDR